MYIALKLATSFCFVHSAFSILLSLFFPFLLSPFLLSPLSILLSPLPFLLSPSSVHPFFLVSSPRSLADFVRQTARATKAAVGTPAYVYDAATLKSNAEACLSFPHAYGLTVRFAMKSLPNKAVLQLFNRCSFPARLGVLPTDGRTD